MNRNLILGTILIVSIGIIICANLLQKRKHSDTSQLPIGSSVGAGTKANQAHIGKTARHGRFTATPAGATVNIGSVQVHIEPPMYELTNTGGSVWMIVVAVTNSTADWKDLKIPYLELHVTTSDDKVYIPAEDYGSMPERLKERLLSLQGIEEFHFGFLNQHPSSTGVGTIAEGIQYFFSPPGKDPTIGPNTARLSEGRCIGSGVLRLELASGQSFRLPLLIDCPQNSKPVKMTWPGVGNFIL